MPNHLKRAVKTAIYLCIYRLGGYGLLRMARRAAGVSRARILLFHRVNDMSRDPLTTDTVSFAEALATLRKYYRARSTSWLVERLKKGEPIPPDTVVIHFDDCYRDVYENAVPLLEAVGFPAAFFVSSGYIDTDRVFPHDAYSPFSFENLRAKEVKDLAVKGFEIGGHTVGHADLGSIQLAEAEDEVLKSREDLQAITGLPVRYFSFPFGNPENISGEVRRLVEESGSEALFSVSGSAVGRRSDLFDMPRQGVSAEHRPLDLLMEMEGISLADARRLLGQIAHGGKSSSA
jgi:peptidoglycan/xylan/chitin deacetylase (PgdA/CDA1 family)